MTGERLVAHGSRFYAFRLEDRVTCYPLLRHIDRFVDCSELRQHLAGLSVVRFFETAGRLN